MSILKDALMAVQSISLKSVAVALMAAEHGLPLEVQQAALLYEAYRYANLGIETIEDRFGPFVAALVKEMAPIDPLCYSTATKYAKMLIMLDIIYTLQEGCLKVPTERHTYIQNVQKLYKSVANTHWDIANELMQVILAAET